VDTMLGNFFMFEDIRDDACEYEVPAIKKIAGEMWKGKADILTKDYVIDLKTSGDVFKFVRNAPYYFYHTQAYIYQKLFGKPVIFLVTGKTKKYDKNGNRYYDLGIFPVSENSMGLAEEKVGQAVASYNKWFASDSQDNIDNYIINTPI